MRRHVERAHPGSPCRVIKHKYTGQPSEVSETADHDTDGDPEDLPDLGDGGNPDAGDNVNPDTGDDGCADGVNPDTGDDGGADGVNRDTGDDGNWPSESVAADAVLPEGATDMMRPEDIKLEPASSPQPGSVADAEFGDRLVTGDASVASPPQASVTRLASTLTPVAFSLSRRLSKHRPR